LFVALYFAWCAMNPSLVGVVLGLKNVVFYVMWFFVLPDIVKTKDDVRNLLTALIFGTVCVSLYNLWRVQQPIGTFPPMRTGLLAPGVLQTHFSSSTLLIPPGLFFLVTLTPRQHGWKKAGLWMCVAIVTMGFLATTSRSPWGTTVAGLLVIAWLSRRVPQMMGILVVVGIAAIVMQASLNVDVSDRALSAFDTSDVSRNARENENSSEMIPFVLTHPVGVGTGSMSARSSAQVWGGSSGKVPTAIQGGLIHNNLLLIAIETGWLGPIIFVWFLVSAVRLAIHNYRKAQDPFIKDVSLALCGIVVFYTGMQVLGAVLVQPSISYIIFALFALLVILPDLDQPQSVAATVEKVLEYA
jgi:hypothetical protein